jgi:hypothetical protein
MHVEVLAWLVLCMISVWHTLVSRASIPTVGRTQPLPAFFTRPGPAVAKSLPSSTHFITVLSLHAVVAWRGTVYLVLYFLVPWSSVVNIFFQQASFLNRWQCYYTPFYKVHKKHNWNYYSVKMFSRLPNSCHNLNCSSQWVCMIR